MNKEQETKSIMLCNESESFDFGKLVKNQNVQTIMNIPVKIDKVLYDLTGETVIGVSGTFVVKGIKVRGVWDSIGNIMHFRNTSIMFGWRKVFDSIFEECTNSMFQLVTVKEMP